MKYRTRIYYTDTQKAEMWDRWQRGETLHSIAWLFDRYHTSVRGILAATGGIRAAGAPSFTFCADAGGTRRDSPRHHRRSLHPVDRNVTGSCTLDHQPRSEPQRWPEEYYRASQADQAAWDRAQRPKPSKLVINRALARIVAKKLRRFWSPEQIAGWLKYAYPNDESSQVSH